jgi:hypothetical protein
MLHMKQLPSATFRKVYAALQEPVIVTVLGRPIGTYTPVSAAVDGRFIDAIRPGEPRVPDAVFAAFRPVPKPGKK